MDLSPTLYIPNFLEPELQSGVDIQEINLHLQEKNWLRTGLIIDEITTALFPTGSGVNLCTGEGDKDKFMVNCQELFPVGHILASFKQLYQVAIMFLERFGRLCPRHIMARRSTAT
jgi:hypothetical protein